MKKIFVLLVCLVCLPGAAVNAQEPTPSEEAALQAYRQGGFSRAVELYTNALSETDDASHRARLHISIAWTLFALGREGEVSTHLNAALLEDPNVPVTPGYYTQEFMELFDQARQRVTMMGAESPGSSSPDLEVTLLSINQRLETRTDLEGALMDVERLIASYPLDGRLVPLRVELLQALGRSAEAEELMIGYGSPMGSSLASMSVPELINRANHLLEDGDVEASLELLRRAVARQPSNVAALELMAEAAQRASRWQEAEFALKSALGLHPDNIGLNLRLGEVYLARGDPSAARDIFRQITERFPHSDRAWAALGLLDARLGNDQRAQRALAQALEENPLLPEVQLAFGEMLLQEKKPEQALEALRAAANLLQNDSQVEARTGQALLALGRTDDALEYLRQGVAGEFRPFDVKRSLAVALIVSKAYSEAERVLEGTGVDSNREADVIRGFLHLEKGENVEAEKLLRLVLVDRTNDPQVLNLLGVAVYRQRRFGEALALLEQAVQLEPTDPQIVSNHGHASAAVAAESLARDARTTRNRLTR